MFDIIHCKKLYADAKKAQDAGMRKIGRKERKEEMVMDIYLEKVYDYVKQHIKKLYLSNDVLVDGKKMPISCLDTMMLCLPKQLRTWFYSDYDTFIVVEEDAIKQEKIEQQQQTPQDIANIMITY